MKKFLLAGIAFAAMVLPAAAADMPLKAPAPVPVDIWSGGYVGANVGMIGVGISSTRSAVRAIAAPRGSPVATCAATHKTTTASSAPKRRASRPQLIIAASSTAVRRATIGSFTTFSGPMTACSVWKWISRAIELPQLHVSLASLTPRVARVNPGVELRPRRLNERINSLGTLRGRAGLLWGPNTLVYVTGGLAFANARSNTGIAQNVTSAGGLGPYATAGQATQEVFGPTIGAGVEWKWTANWSVKAEYLYVDLAELSYNTNALISPFAGAGGGNFSVANVNQTVHIHDNIARVGVNYRFW